MRLEAIARLASTPDTAGRLGRGASLTLLRAWPRSSDHLLLEYTDQGGRITPGQWMRDAERLHGVEKETAVGGGEVAHAATAATSLVSVSTGAVLLQTGGADRRLKGLAETLATPGTTLVSHRPERRAVVRREANGEVRFGKIVRRSRLETQVTAHEHVVQLDGRPFAVPEIIETNPGGGVVWFRALEGRCLHDDGGGAQTAGAVGRTLRWLHDASAPAVSAKHDAQAEIDLLKTRLEWLEIFAPDEAARLRSAAPAVLESLAAKASSNGLLHRDFYDKQIFVDREGGIALLDFDTLARGETALDIANMLAHIELRALQGQGDNSNAQSSAEAFMHGYDPSPAVRNRIPAYLAAARLRLACLYAYRPCHASLSAALADRLVTL